MATYVEIICGFVAVFLAFYYYLTSTFDFWKVRGVPGPRPMPVFGNMKNVVLLKTSTSHFVRDIYYEYKDEPMVGIFIWRTPVIILHDPELIKDVLIRDFSKFADRGFPVVEKAEPLSPNLFNLEAERWRPMRAKLSPIFTSGKLREMFPLIMECSNHLEQYLDKLVSKGEPVECRELIAKYTTDVIGSCAFGLEINALSDEESEFRRVGRQVFGSLSQVIRFRIKEMAPTFYNLLGYVLPPTEITTFYTKIIVDTLAYRKENNIVRPDFVNMLLELKKNADKVETIELTDTLLTAQAFVFFVAGFETSATTMTHVLYELALNDNIQKKLRQEIKEHFEKNNGELKYDDIKNMTYLDLVFRETLRKYPPGPILIRKSVADYTFKNTKVTIPKKSFVWVPLYALHHDPAIYPNPDAFIPERFTDDAVAARHPMHYLPFGDGPRNCIGARFAIYQSKIGLITILRNYRVEVCDKTMIPYVIDPASFLVSPKGGIYLKFTKEES
ncbi:putative cytochrome P450 6a14 [Xylocopa sonorina]|uniref:putative cytochrome P450 6a14 n=1 Tax=Xylocopa sonorina TaxID=1818115 RepID=UPI00403AF9BA